MMLGDPAFGRRGEELAQRDVADELAVVVHGVEALDRLDLGIDLLQVLESLARRSTPGGSRANFSVMRRPAVRGGIAEEPLRLGGVAGRHLREQGLALALGQMLEEERDLVGGKPVELGAELLRRRAVEDERAASRP